MSVTTTSKTVKIALISIIIITVSVIIGYYIGKRQVSDIVKDTVDELKDEAAITMNDVHQEGIREGKKEWTLDAAAVEYNIPKNQALFKDISLVYFMKGNKNIYLTANKGVWYKESNDIEITGNVFVKNEDYKLKTEVLFYDDKARKLYSRSPVKIYDGKSTLMAKSMSIDLNTNNLTFSGVRGEFSGDMPL